MNILPMHSNRDIYWNEKIQKVRWTNTPSYDVDFKYIGSCSQTELELLIEKLFELYEDKHISTEMFVRIFSGFRNFCDNLNQVVNDENL